MFFVSVTRLRIRSWLYVPQFVWHTLQATRQVLRAPGFLGGRLLRESNNALWTVTVWEDAEAMKAYRSSGGHMKAMPKLLEWCDEASIGHWSQVSEELPSWSEAHQKMAAEGRVSKVSHPSAVQAAKQIPEPQKAGREGLLLKPTTQAQ